VQVDRETALAKLRQLPIRKRPQRRRAPGSDEEIHPGAVAALVHFLGEQLRVVRRDISGARGPTSDRKDHQGHALDL
jgi:hypothetical protein